MNTEDFLVKAVQAAKDAGHIWPEYAACEAALESGWGNSQLARECNNLFGQKSGHTSGQYPQKSIPTHEWSDGHLVPARASWPVFPDWKTSFMERMGLLNSLSVYQDAISATTGKDFVVKVSAHWATDPDRAAKVLNIYSHHFGD